MSAMMLESSSSISTSGMIMNSHENSSGSGSSSSSKRVLLSFDEGSDEYKCLSLALSYPIFQSQEQTLKDVPYNVMGWYTYLTQIVQAMEQLLEFQQQQQQQQQESTNNNNNNNKKKKKKNSSVLIAGKEYDHHIFTDYYSNNNSNDWMRKVESELWQIFEWVSQRAIGLLPKSYKLWKYILDTLVKQYHYQQRYTNNNNNDNHVMMVSVDEIEHAFETCLYHCHKYPAIWQDYGHFVWSTNTSNSTELRRLYNRALLALPVTQHDRIWPDYLRAMDIIHSSTNNNNNSNTNDDDDDADAMTTMPLLLQQSPHYHNHSTTHDWTATDTDNHRKKKMDVPSETKWRILSRYVKGYDISSKALLAQLALSQERYGQAAELYVELLNTGTLIHTSTNSQHDIWTKLCQIGTQHPQSISTTIHFPSILRTALQKQQQQQQQQSVTNMNHKTTNSKTEMEGMLWNHLGQYYTALGDFEMARGIYEEGMQSVTKVRDFSILFDQYMQLEEQLTEAYMTLYNQHNDDDDDDDDNDNDDNDDDDDDDDNGKQNTNKSTTSLSSPTSTTTTATHDDDDDLHILLGHDNNDNNEDDKISSKKNYSADLELALARAERLMVRRPLLLNRVYLKQNPYNIGRWMERSKLYQQQQQINHAIQALEEGMQSISNNPSHCHDGTPGMLYIQMASLYQHQLNNIDQARQTYQRICAPNPMTMISDKLAKAEDWAQCYISYVNMELALEQWDTALDIIRHAVNVRTTDSNTITNNSTKSKKEQRLRRHLQENLSLWNLLLDLEESLGTTQTTKDAYHAALHRKVATTNHILQFTSFLQELNYYEESFSVYETAVEMFQYTNTKNPQAAHQLWTNYLTQFTLRYKGTQMARTRELYDRCLTECTTAITNTDTQINIHEIYIQYGKWEEQYGLTKRALSVYERMCTDVQTSTNKEKMMAYELYIAKTCQYRGVEATRPLYERAIAALEDLSASKMCIQYAQMEITLQEYERARAAFTYGAQMADPRISPDYYQTWHTFEVEYGNEETFREMLRIKRSVIASFSTVNYNATINDDTTATTNNNNNDTLTEAEALAMIEEREGLESSLNKKERLSGFVQAKRTSEMTDLEEVERRAEKLRKVMTTSTSNNNAEEHDDEDEIDLDDDDDDDDDDNDDVKGSEQIPLSSSSPVTSSATEVQNVSTKSVPLEVFGGLIPPSVRK